MIQQPVAPTISADANTAACYSHADATSTTTDVTDRAAAPANTATVDTNSGQEAPSTNVQAAAANTVATRAPTDTNNATATATTDRAATATTDRAATTDAANTEARTRSRRALAETREANTNTATGIQWINGKQYYVSDGSVRKNFVFEQDGKSYYFDAETGLLRPSHRMNFQQNLSRQIVDFSSEIKYKTITNHCGPTRHFHCDAGTVQSILKDGKTWTASTEADKRPL